MPAAKASSGVGLATRIALAASTLTLVFVLVLGGTSYVVTRSQITQGVENTLDNQASLLAGRLSLTLSAVVKTLGPLAQNALILNSLMDSLTRDTSLKPFLADFSTINGVPVEISLTDFEGHTVAGTRSPTVATSWKIPVLSEGRSYVSIEKNSPHAHLIVAEPIFHMRTLSPEGALIHTIDLDWLIKDFAAAGNGEPIRLLQHGEPILHDGPGAIRNPLDPPMLTRTRLLEVPEILAPLGLAVEVSADPSVVRKPLDRLLLIYVLLGLALIAAVIILSTLAARRLARPLRDLEHVAATVVASGSFDHRFAGRGFNEVARLGQTFNLMLERLGAAHDQLSNLAHQDTLTGLANRKLFHDHLRTDLGNAKRSQELLAILLVDLDNFKDINDTLGHPLGDDLLKQVASRLRNLVRDTDTVARLGGDEFAIIGTHLNDANDAAILGQKIIAAAAESFEIFEHKIFVTASAGIAFFPVDGGDGDQLLKNADLALYKAKEEGRGRYQFYDLELNTAAQKRKQMEASIRAALQTSAFCLHYQPKVNMQTGDLAGVEALLRWNSENGLVPPSEFIPVAETSGLIIPLGEWVLREVCAQKLTWEQAGLPVIPVAVNLSAVQLRQDKTVKRLVQVIAESGVEPGELEIEITESALMEKEECTARRLGIFRELGVRLAIDDFGTGYSSLSHLKRLSVDSLKIDCSFVRDIGVDADDAAIAKAIIQLGASLNLTVVAEGLETNGHAEFLIQQGCQLAQGYYYSPALDADSFVSWLLGRTSGHVPRYPAQYSNS